MNRILLGYAIFTSVSFLFFINFALSLSDEYFVIPEPLIPLIGILPFLKEIKASAILKVAMLCFVTLFSFVYFLIVVEFGGEVFPYDPYLGTFLSFLSIALVTCLLWFGFALLIEKINQKKLNADLKNNK